MATKEECFVTKETKSSIEMVTLKKYNKANIYSYKKGVNNLAKNKEMQKLRIELGDITQEEAADRMNVSPSTYRQVECGLRRGSNDFWDKFQEAFKIPNEKMRAYQKGCE